MRQVTRTARAEEDLIEIWLYIAAANPTAADKLLDTIERAFARLGENPQLGPARRDLAPDLRYLPIGRYLILYRAIPQGVEVVRVVHGARRLPNLL